MVVRREKFANDASTDLDGAINDSVTSVTVTLGSVFPSVGDFRIIVNSEIMLVTARATNVLTVTRGVDDTSAAAHSDEDVIKCVVAATAFTELGDDFVLPASFMGKAASRMPYRLLSDAGVTLTSSDFGWVNQDTAAITDDTNGSLSVVVDQTAGADFKLLTRTMPSPPFTLTANLMFGAGCVSTSTTESAMGIGFRDSGSSRFEIGVAELNDVLTFKRYTDVSTFSANSATSDSNEVKWEEIWMQIEDDNANIYFRVSMDGLNWFLVGQDTRTAWLASADQICWAFNERGAANKIYHLRSWVEE